jgi:hypothetical protein
MQLGDYAGFSPDGTDLSDDQSPTRSCCRRGADILISAIGVTSANLPSSALVSLRDDYLMACL